MPRREIASATRGEAEESPVQFSQKNRLQPHGGIGATQSTFSLYFPRGYLDAGGLAALGTFSQSARNFLMPASVSGWLASWVMTL